MPISLTVDACVLRASGLNSNELASLCRRVLEAIWKGDAKLIFSAELKTEWDKHKSKHGAGWLARMHSSKRLSFVRVGGPHFNGISRAIEHLPPEQIAAARKDIHLVSAAVQFDSAIVSYEVNCRSKYHSIIQQYPPLAYVVWLDPLRHAKEVALYIEGAPVANECRLSFDT